jgi:hypothetical protein
VGWHTIRHFVFHPCHGSKKTDPALGKPLIVNTVTFVYDPSAGELKKSLLAPRQFISMMVIIWSKR